MSINEKILIIDYGSQYTLLLGRAVRQAGVYCEIYTWEWPTLDRIRALNPKGIILSGSPHCICDRNSPTIDTAILEEHTKRPPILGVCYGMQMIVKYLGGGVESTKERKELGEIQLHLTEEARNCVWFDGVDTSKPWRIFASHTDSVTKLPKGFVTLGYSGLCPIAVAADSERQMYLIQYHPEVGQGELGTIMIERFLKCICKCSAVWTPKSIIPEIIDYIHNEVGNENDASKGDVILALSGGVDSSVAACLLDKAIGSRLKCIFVNSGLLRKNEEEQVKRSFSNYDVNLQITYVDAASTFLSRLEGVCDPEEKRKIIGKTFIETFESTSQKFNQVKYLAQGTIYPDLIESSNAGNSSFIKSHHNVGGLPAAMKLKILEPLQKLFKDEVRDVGVLLGLPSEFVKRHPFPGPGLAVRIIGGVTEERCSKVREADHIFIQELKNAGWYDKCSQAYAALLTSKSVAVKGDRRFYDEVIVLRSVDTIDFMTARSTPLPWDLLMTAARRICNEVDGISRVTFDITEKPPATIEWE